METDLKIWDDNSQLKKIRASLKEMYGSDLSDAEFDTFVAIGQATGLNPFLREIYAVKYGQKAASIFIGRDGYRKAAQMDPQYDYHVSDAIYSGDTFTVENGIPKHNYNQGDRGSILGAYCIVKRKSSSQPIYVYVEFKEYYNGHRESYPNGNIKRTSYGQMKPTIWDEKPATMIKKVAEAQALRMAFQNVFAGTYDESEKWQVEEEIKKEEKKDVIDIVDQEGAPTSKQAEEIYTLLEEYISLVEDGKSPEYIAAKATKAIDSILPTLDEKTADDKIKEMKAKIADTKKEMKEALDKAEREAAKEAGIQTADETVIDGDTGEIVGEEVKGGPINKPAAPERNDKETHVPLKEEESFTEKAKKDAKKLKEKGGIEK